MLGRLYVNYDVDEQVRPSTPRTFAGPSNIARVPFRWERGGTIRSFADARRALSVDAAGCGEPNKPNEQCQNFTRLLV